MEYDKVGQVEVAGIGRVQPAQQDNGGVDAEPPGQHMGWVAVVSVVGKRLNCSGCTEWDMVVLPLGRGDQLAGRLASGGPAGWRRPSLGEAASVDARAGQAWVAGDGARSVTLGRR